ncbi:hydrolase Nlp/P60 [Brumimicrobium salinarum]|uniref:Hydrolase Nlp/P60 n=1 Tax=Brumimicrobium salinarum TaxID=2058658 RepID=A0A2I0R4Q9_9FLAO|nr:C40 family peptidase [Brumimicrobium salinarum]PKR81557.1 hydrolase Nlp/P60 [Brumimicrobium salinarum]
MSQAYKAICKLTVIPVRSNPNDTAEMVTQLLFGDLVTCISSIKNWVEIIINHDQYKGWVDEKQLLKINTQEAEAIAKVKTYQLNNTLSLKTPWGEQLILSGSPVLSKEKQFSINDLSFEWKNNTPKQDTKDLLECAKSYLNAPYLWGGKTRFGIDCSGLTQTVYQQIGIQLKRDASQQVKQGEDIELGKQKAGDLAFFESTTTGKITHVGILLNENEIIHAHGRVRIDQLDSKGIYNRESEYYSHQYHSIRRYI